MALIERLKMIQEAHRWDDVEMARRLGLSPRMWPQVREGRTRFGAKTLRAVLTAFPEVGPDVLAYLTTEPAAA